MICGCVRVGTARQVPAMAASGVPIDAVVNGHIEQGEARVRPR
jgi:hypothetical protein